MRRPSGTAAMRATRIRAFCFTVGVEAPVRRSARAMLLPLVCAACILVAGAEVRLTDMSHRLESQVADPNERLEILRSVHRNATRAHVAPELVLAVIDVE